MRTPFQRDRDRIVHSKPFRRLKGKTQVFIDPQGDHYRTRMTHTLETTAISRVVARALRLNEDLTEAIGLGHDLGHTPFGHAGEDALDRALRERFGGSFRHNEQSYRIARAPEPDARGLRGDPHAHRDGRAGDAGGADRPPRRPRRVHQPRHRRRAPLRAPRGGRPPQEEIELLGPTGGKRIDRLVHDLVETSAAAGDIRQSEEIGGAMHRLREFMFERVYLAGHALAEQRRAHDDDREDRRAPRRAWRLARRDRRVCRRDDRPVRARIR